jgi:hypothetical protein
VCLWTASLVGLRSTVLAEIVQACAGLLGTAWQRLCMSVDCWLHRSEGCSPGEIVNVCGSPAWAGLRGSIWQRLWESEGWQFGVAWPWWG